MFGNKSTATISKGQTLFNEAPVINRRTTGDIVLKDQTNVRSNSSEPINPRIPENVPTLGSLFSENGYEAVHFGKTHDMGSLRGFKHCLLYTSFCSFVNLTKRKRHGNRSDY